MMIDAHAHYEPRLLGEKDLIALLDFEKIDQMILVPHLTNPPEPAKPAILMSVQRFMFSFDLLRPLGIWITQLMYKSDGKWNFGPLAWFMKAKTNSVEIVQKPDHSLIDGLIEKYPNRFSQWLFINPKKTTPQEFQQMIAKSKNVVGLKLHPFWHKFSLSEFDAFAPVVKLQKLPVNIHLGHSSPIELRNFLDRHQEIQFIFGHLGVPFYKALWREIKNRKNCFLDVSSTYHVDERLLRQAVAFLGAERILFASDTPYTAPGSVETLKAWINRLPISEKEREQIFIGNFQRIVAKK